MHSAGTSFRSGHWENTAPRPLEEEDIEVRYSQFSSSLVQLGQTREGSQPSTRVNDVQTVVGRAAGIGDKHLQLVRDVVFVGLR